MSAEIDYLKLVRWSEEDGCYVGSIPDLCGDCCHGDSQVEVYQQLVDIHDGWLDTLKEDLPPIETRPMKAVAWGT